MKSTKKLFSALRAVASILVLLCVLGSFSLGSLAAEGVGGFVERCYLVALGRAPEQDGFDYWVGKLNAKELTGTSVAQQFIFSNEYLSKGTNDSQYIRDLYTMFMDRDPDSDGFTYWSSRLSSGDTRETVFAGFAGSPEFSGICASYGVEVGSLEAPPSNESSSAGFVKRLYSVVLGRECDEQGLNAWCAQLDSGASTGIEVAYGFFFSPEYRSNLVYVEQYIDDLYAALLGRAADEGGRDNWVKVFLSERYASEQIFRHVFNGFAASPEFAGLCQQYGINQGNPVPELLHTRGEAVAYANGLVGLGIDYDGGAGNQCVDLIFQYMDWLGACVVYGNGYDFVNAKLPVNWSYVSSPMPGDIIVWDRFKVISENGGRTGEWGHVGIVVAVNGNTLTTIEQNAGYSYCTVNTRPASMATTFIRPCFAE